MFEMKSENCDFLKNKLKDICFSTLKSYSFEKLKKKLSQAEFLDLKNLIEHKDLVNEKADKANTVVIANRTKYLEVIKSHFLDSRKFIPLPTNEDKWINYIIPTYTYLFVS